MNEKKGAVGYLKIVSETVNFYHYLPELKAGSKAIVCHKEAKVFLSERERLKFAFSLCGEFVPVFYLGKNKRVVIGRLKGVYQVYFNSRYLFFVYESSIDKEKEKESMVNDESIKRDEMRSAKEEAIEGSGKRLSENSKLQYAVQEKEKEEGLQRQLQLAKMEIKKKELEKKKYLEREL